MKSWLYLLLLSSAFVAQAGRRIHCGVAALAPDELAPNPIPQLQAELADLVWEAASLHGAQDAVLKSLLQQNITRLREQLENASHNKLSRAEMAELLAGKESRARAAEEQAAVAEGKTRTKEHDSTLSWGPEPVVLREGFLPKAFDAEPNSVRVVPFPDGGWRLLVEVPSKPHPETFLIDPLNGQQVSLGHHLAFAEAIVDAKGQMTVVTVPHGKTSEPVVQVVDPVTGKITKHIDVMKALPGYASFVTLPVVQPYLDAKGKVQVMLSCLKLTPAEKVFYRLDLQTGKAVAILTTGREAKLYRSPDGKRIYVYGLEKNDNSDPTKLFVRELTAGGKIVMEDKLQLGDDSVYVDVNSLAITENSQGVVHLSLSKQMAETVSIYRAGVKKPMVYQNVKSLVETGELMAGPGGRVYHFTVPDNGRLDYFEYGDPAERHFPLIDVEFPLAGRPALSKTGPLLFVPAETDKTKKPALTTLSPTAHTALQTSVLPEYADRFHVVHVDKTGRVLAVAGNTQGSSHQLHLLQVFGPPGGKP